MTHISNITIYLLKPFDDITNLIRVPSSSTSKCGEILFESDNCWFIGKTEGNTPAWVTFCEDSLSSDNKPLNMSDFKNLSSYGLYVKGVECKGEDNDDIIKYFAIPFGHGIHLLNMKYVEPSFGLKVTVNAVDYDNLRQIDLTTPEKNSQKKKFQSSINETVDSFEINQQKDLLRGLSGTMPKRCQKNGKALLDAQDLEKARVYDCLNDAELIQYPLGKSLSGKDGLRVGYKINDMNDIHLLCKRAFIFYNSDRYKQNFSWFDNFRAVSANDDILVELNNALVETIVNKTFDNMSIVSPEYIDETVLYDGYVFSGNGKKITDKTPEMIPMINEFCDEIGKDKLKKYLEKNEEELLYKGVKYLKESCKLILRSIEGRSRDKEWPLFNSIAWEKELRQERYILCEGSWYQISSDFREEVESFFSSAIRDKSELMIKPKMKYEDGKYEAGYNAHVVENSDGDAIVFDLGVDRSLGIGKDRNEFCDIFDMKRGHIIHVKIGKSSANLSHLFRQGAFSAKMLKKDSDFREEIVQKIKVQNYDVQSFSNFNAKKFKVCFAVVLDSNQKKDIPFFSKVSFKDAIESNIERDGYLSEFWFIFKTTKK